MQSIQEIYNRVQKAKKKQRDLMSACNDALKGSMEYVETDEKLKSLREKKKQIQSAIKSQFASEMTALEDLKIDIASDIEMLSDAAMTRMMKGETIAVEDEYGNQYEPVFKVNFKKVA